MKISSRGLDLIKQFEGCRLTAYKCVSTETYYTIGYGHYGADVSENMKISQAQADAYLIADLARFEGYVNNAAYCPITNTLNQNQFDALVSFAYNCGQGSLKKLCANSSAAQIAEKIPAYNKAGGKVLQGLVNRRAKEKALFLEEISASQNQSTQINQGGTTLISNCGKDENGKYSGGKAGDQTGKEYCITSWYNRPWACVLRHPNAAVQEDLAKVAIAAAKNELIGYDQGQRGTYYNHLKASHWDPAKVTIACEADCSSSTAANIIAVGYRLGIVPLQNINKNSTTSVLRKNLTAAGFNLLTDSKYLSSDAYLLPGDVLLYDGHHVAINVSTGSKVQTSSQSNQSSAGGTQTSSGALSKALQAATKKSSTKAGTYKTTTALNLRYGAGSDKYAIIVEMPKGTVCRNYGYYSLDAAGGAWLYVVAAVNGKQYTGYAKASYLSK